MKKRKAKKSQGDPRVKTARFSWKEYAGMYFILLSLAAGQWLIYAEYMDFTSMPFEYIMGMLGYWALVTAAFCFITVHQRVKAFDRPMRKLSEAAKQVAEGDFTVYLEPEHSPDKMDYVDVMFEDFNKMVEELASIETLKDDFIANVSHEMKTPLAIIQSYATALKKEGLDPVRRAEYVDTLVTASENLTTLISNILKLNKLLNQEILSVSEPYDLCRQLSDCAISFEKAWEQKDIEFSADMDDRVIIQADEGMLEIVWHNLFSNALKYTEPGGMVTLTQTSDDDSVTVSVSDTGCGMEEETMKHIFDKFYQGDTSHSHEGNGLGLSLVARVIDLVGGSISVKSKMGKGSAFTVRLSLYSPE